MVGCGYLFRWESVVVGFETHSHGGDSLLLVRGGVDVVHTGALPLCSWWRDKDDASGSAGGEGGCYKNFPVYSSSILLFPFLRKGFCTRKGFVCGGGEVGFETHSHGGDSLLLARGGVGVAARGITAIVFVVVLALV